MTEHLRKCAPAVVLCLSVLAAPRAASGQQAGPLTVPERTDYRQTSRYADVVAFMEAVAAKSPLIQLDTFGYTVEGRALPLAVVGKGLTAATPEAVLATGRTRVYLQGNIHAGEVEGKESLLMLLRDIAAGGHAEWLDSLVLLIAPIYNADGNERIVLTNRPGQNGPVGGMGQRPNAQDLDLNRDHMKLESPEAHSLALLLQRYDPQVGIDLHTTDGSRHAYYLTYSPPLHPNTDSTIVRFLRERWFPAVTRAVKQKHGWDFYYYGNAQGRDQQRGWYTFDHRPRFNNNYLGLRNRFGILSEAYAYATFEDRIKATSWFVEALLDFATRNATAIRRIVARADSADITGSKLAVQAEIEKSAQPADILMGEVAQERNPYSGAIMLRRLPAVHTERMYEYGTFRGTVFEQVPRTYLVPPQLGEVVARLQAQGVATRVLEAERTLEVERFRIDSTWAAPRPFQGHQERSVKGVYETASVTVPAGTVVVPVGQPLGRLIFSLLEPESDDGFLDWNLLDRALEGVRYYPILRTTQEVR